MILGVQLGHVVTVQGVGLPEGAWRGLRQGTAAVLGVQLGPVMLELGAKTGVDQAALEQAA